MPETTETIDYEAAWLIAEQRTRDEQAQNDLLTAEIERLRAENGRMKRALQAITSSQFKGRDWPEVYDRLLALAYEGLGTDKEQPATSA